MYHSIHMNAISCADSLAGLPLKLKMRSDRLDDAQGLSYLWRQPGVFESLGQMPNVSPEYVMALFKARARRDCGWIIEGEHGSILGNTMLMEANSSPRRSHCATMMVAVSSAHRQKGLGRALVRQAVDHARGWTSFHRVELVVAASNAAALALYEGAGFVREGVLQDYVLTHGDFEDVVTMALMLRK